MCVVRRHSEIDCIFLEKVKNLSGYSHAIIIKFSQWWIQGVAQRHAPLINFLLTVLFFLNGHRPLRHLKNGFA